MKKQLIARLAALALLLGAGRDAWGLEPFDNIARPQGTYLMLYPQYTRATRMMDKDGNALPTNPDATLYQSLFKLCYSPFSIGYVYFFSKYSSTGSMVSLILISFKNIIVWWIARIRKIKKLTKGTPNVSLTRFYNC